MRPRAAWAAVAAAGVLITFAPATVGVRTLSQRDTDQLYAPVRTLVVEELRAGRLPLWNPHEGAGKPLLAEGIHGVLHPISLLAAAVAPASIDVLLLAYLVAAAVGSFALASVLGASGPAACAAGLAFALSGYSVSMTGNLVFLAGLSTLPWVLAAARAAGAGARWGAVSTALATACAFLAGDAQVALVGLALGVLLAADAGGVRGALRAAGGVAAGVLLAGVQIAPTRALLERTARGLGLPEEEKTRWALEPARIVEWVVPGLFRGPLDETPIVRGRPRLDHLVFAESVYVGAPLLVAAALAPWRRSRRTVLLLASASGVVLWLALGHHLGAQQLLDAVPVWSRFRYSEKLMAPLTLCACALAALGVDAFGAAPLATGVRRALALVTAGAGALLAFTVLAPGRADAVAEAALGELGPFRCANLSAGLPHLLVALGAILAADRLRAPGPRGATLAALVALAPAAAVYLGAHLGAPELRSFETPIRLEAVPPGPRILHALDRLRSPRDPLGPVDATARSEHLLLGEAVPVAHRVDTLESYGAFAPRRLELLAGALDAAWVRAARRFALTHLPFQAFPHATAAQLARAAVEGGRLVQRDGVVEVWEVPHRAWSFFAARALAVRGPEEALRVLVPLIASGDDATVVVEADAAPGTAPGTVLAVARAPRSVTIDAEAAGPALLVVQDAYAPGWRAAVDGRPAELLAADVLVRAVAFPPGRHRVEMTYDPPELREGLGLSAAGAVLVVLLAARASRRRPGAGA